jgi:hypothetical protein
VLDYQDLVDEIVVLVSKELHALGYLGVDVLVLGKLARRERCVNINNDGVHASHHFDTFLRNMGLPGASTSKKRLPGASSFREV